MEKMKQRAIFEGKPYEPGNIEPSIYKEWEESGFFNPDTLPGKRKENYIVYMPLPNVTGSLHMGHALDNTFQDILARHFRMRGRRVLWLPGTDHAGISTQYVVEKDLKKKGISRFDLGREEFVKKVWEWKKEYGGIIISQLKKLGCSADWSRERFTMDEAYAKDVMHAFLHYHKEGLLYRGLRTVNWCPRCGTSLSELELEYKDEKTNLWHFKYPLGDGKFVTVATTRPETMLGDTAIAVNPKDERWKLFIGKSVTLPIQNREIPIVADEFVDMEFGTGAVKVTPAHDVNDWGIAERHNLQTIQVIDGRGRMTAEAGEGFEGLKAAEAREKIVAEMEKLGFLEKIEEYEHRISVCARCGHSIEPIPSKQWFVKMNRLAKATQKSLKKGEVKIRPENFGRTAEAWLSNIRDWTVSRQIWWGHRLPVWFCENDKEKYSVSVSKPEKCPFCKSCEMKQSDDVLDTWFSSALWPFAGLSESDRKKYYPGNTLITARDIINLWVSRMVFSGLEFMGHAPFRDVLIHGTILTKDGKRMSKSLGTGIDPLKYIESHGADATRFAVVWQSTGQDIRWDESAVAAGKKFLNKLWNASRFVLTKTDEPKQASSAKTAADEKILKALLEVKKNYAKRIENFEFSEVLKELYEFFWHDFCDEYIEAAKPQLENTETRENTSRILREVLMESLVLLHPFLPFVTEEIYRSFPGKETEFLMVYNEIE